MKKFFTSFLFSIFLTFTSLTTVLAGTWIQNQVGWWYQNDDSSYPTNGWYWIDGNHDGIAECYYFNESGYCLMNTTTPDGYTVDANGAWSINGIVQTQTAQVQSQTTQPSNTSSVSSSTDNGTHQENIAGNWSGNFPYVAGMIQEKPSDGSFWTVNINTGKYHATANVDNLLAKNTRYYIGDASTLESYGYTRCKKRGCY